jgi:Zn/Cd-binding protein ZinT
MSRLTAFSLILMLVISTASFSNVTIMGKHKNFTRDGKKINCNYCHAGSVKLEKKKGQFADGKVNGKKRSQMKACAGKDCHK